MSFYICQIKDKTNECKPLQDPAVPEEMQWLLRPFYQNLQPLKQAKFLYNYSPSIQRIMYIDSATLLHVNTCVNELS